MFMFIMLQNKTGHNEYCKEHFPNAFCVVTINKKFHLSNALNLRFRGSQRLERKQFLNTARKAGYTLDTLLY